MVFCTRVLCTARKVSRKYLRNEYIDSMRITVRGGSGGGGMPKYGGKGGNGGSIYVQSTDQLESLYQLKKKLSKSKVSAESGTDSRSKCIIGMHGDDTVLKVPVGIKVHTSDGIFLGELIHSGDKLLVAQGGKGGCAETEYIGFKGQSRTIILDLNLIADVGLVGYPNAGKSTLLSVISNAKPKIASYPFTTVKPQLGTIVYPDQREITVADLPGIMEGAHANVGMGFKFLKHIQRTRMLVFITDIQGFQYRLSDPHRSCLETIFSLNKELEAYNPDLINMPALLLVNKMDTKSANYMYDELRAKLENLKDAFDNCDESIEPDNFLSFKKVLPVSLKLKITDEIAEIKEVIRNIIETDAERRESSNYSTDPKDHLRDNLEKFFKTQTPILT